MLRDFVNNWISEKQRLKEQLDREVEINRKMKNALEKYANNTNWSVDRYSNKYKKWLRSENDFKLAQQVLKELDKINDWKGERMRVSTHKLSLSELLYMISETQDLEYKDDNKTNNWWKRIKKRRYTTIS